MPAMGILQGPRWMTPLLQAEQQDQEGCMSVCQSIWKGTIWLLLRSGPRSQKHPRERLGRCGWGCWGSCHCLPMPALLEGCGVSMVVVMALCLPMDGAAPSAEGGTALLKPGQCLSAAR